MQTKALAPSRQNCVQALVVVYAKKLANDIKSIGPGDANTDEVTKRMVRAMELPRR